MIELLSEENKEDIIIKRYKLGNNWHIFYEFYQAFGNTNIVCFISRLKHMQ